MDTKQFKNGIKYSEEYFNNPLIIDKQIINKRYNLDNKEILDFGCGMGGLSCWYAKTWNCNVHAIDIDSHHIEIANYMKNKYNLKNIIFEKIDISEIPLKKKYDYIFLNDVAEHIKLSFLENFLIQFSKHLNTNAKIFITYPPWKSPYASHLNSIIRIPWCQFLPQKLLLNLIKKRDKTIVGEIESNYFEAYKGLNHLTHKKITHLIKKTNLNVSFRKNHCILNKIPLLKNINFTLPPFNFIITKEFIELEKINNK